MKDCPFPTDFCPLCQSKLVNVDENSISYQCQNVIVNDDSLSYRYHYYVDVSNYNINKESTHYQNIVVLPFLFYSCGSDGNTEIYWCFNEYPMDTVLALPRITDWSNPEKLVE